MLGKGAGSYNGQLFFYDFISGYYWIDKNSDDFYLKDMNSCLKGVE